MATATARSPPPGQARPCCAMRRSADSSPFKPADCPQRSASSISKGGGVCGCHPSPRRSWEKENDATRTPKAARSSASKNFMAPTISATSKAVAASPSPRKKVLGERNEEAHLFAFAPSSPANLALKPKGPQPEAGSARRLRLSFDGPAPAPPAAASHGFQRSFGGEDAEMENHHHAVADSVDAEPSPAALYDPKTNYTSPRPRFLHYKPNPRIEMYRHGGSGARRLDEGLASESSEESLTTTTDDDLDEPSALAAPSEAGDRAAVLAAVSCVLQPEPAPGSPQAHVLTSEPAAMSQPARVLATEPRVTSPRTRAAVPAAVSCVLPPEPAPGSPRAPVLTSEPAVRSPPALVLATEPRATSPRARALSPEPEVGVSSARAPAKKRSTLRFMFPLALVLFMAAAFVCVSLPPNSPIMSNTAVSKVSNFLSVQELHPVELAAWLKQWSSSSLDSIASYWEAFGSTQEQEYFGPHFAANLSAADADHGADFYYNLPEASPMPGEGPVGASVLEEQLKFQDVISASNTDLTAVLEGDVVVEEESDASDYYKVVEDLDVEISEEVPASNGASFMEEQLNVQDVASASTDLTAQAENAVVVEEELIDAAVAEDFDLEMSEEAPVSNGEEMTSFGQNLDIPSEPTGLPEQDVESDESQDDHANGKDGQEAYLDQKSDSSMWPSYLEKISKSAAAGVALLVVILSAGIAVFSMRKRQTQVASNASAPAEEPEQAQAENQSVEAHHLVAPSQSVSGSSGGHLVKPSQFQSPMAEETERFGDSAYSQYSSSLSSGQGRRRKAKEEESLLGLEPTSRRESTSQSTASLGSFTTLIAAKKKNKDDEAMTPVRRSSRLRSVKTPES
ncbi:unnamed protein product [Alopecurus aequalis]